MSDSPKKLGRPRKKKARTPLDKRTPLAQDSKSGDLLAGRAMRERNVNQRRLDPLNDYPEFASFFGRLVSGFRDQAHSVEGMMIGIIKCITDRVPETIADAFLPPAENLAEPFFERLDTERQHWRECAGALLSGAVEHFTADDAEELFGIIVKIKRTHEQVGSHANAWALAAYNDFMNEAGSEPSKVQLRKFIMARPEKYRQRPADEDKKGWTRLWKSSGLFSLPDR